MQPAASLESFGLEGQLHLPTSGDARLCVMLLGGSSGGLTQGATASALASAGFAVLELAYCNYRSLPARLHRIPLEYFARAADWLQHHSQPRFQSVVAMGGSRGAELALELAATYPVFAAVIATSPSHVRFGAVGGRGAAWTLGGKDLPHVLPRTEGRPAPHEEELDGVIYASSRAGYLHDLEANPTLCEAEIAVERSAGPLLLFAGEDDQLWPSDRFAALIGLRARRHGFAHTLHIHTYPDVGHIIPAPGEQGLHRVRFPNGRGLLFGGRPDATERAALDRWTRSVAFLEDLRLHSAA